MPQPTDVWRIPIPTHPVEFHEHARLEFGAEPTVPPSKLQNVAEYRRGVLGVRHQLHVPPSDLEP